MKQAVLDAKILIVSDSSDDARQVQRQLSADFSQVQISTDAQRYLEDFERAAPGVLVLAFDVLETAKSYYLGLYRLGGAVPQHPHATVVLCHRDEVPVVFDMCKKGFFDDYVLYWPHSHDGSRLLMSVWIACRAVHAQRPGLPKPAELVVHARHVSELDRLIEREVGRAGEQVQAGPSRVAVEAWAHHLKDVIEPALAGSRLLTEKMRHIRPVVMVIEDDAFARTLVERALEPSEWETTFAVDSATALAQLRSLRPDVILMDLHLPGLDGVTLTQLLKSSPHLAGIPIVMMTGDANKNTLASSMKAGAASFVVKPFTRTLLTNKLKAALS